MNLKIHLRLFSSLKHIFIRTQSLLFMSSSVARLQGLHQGLPWGRPAEGCGGSSKSHEGFRSVWSSDCTVFLSSPLSNVTLCSCFEQEPMRAPSLNFWEAAATSRGFRWLQPIKLPMGRSAPSSFPSWGWHQPAALPPHPPPPPPVF